jgi:hypothetical protein
MASPRFDGFFASAIPPPPAHSFIIGPAVINTHTCKGKILRSEPKHTLPPINFLAARDTPHRRGTVFEIQLLVPVCRPLFSTV